MSSPVCANDIAVQLHASIGHGQHAGPLGDGARNRDRLLLASRELRREVVAAFAETHNSQRVIEIQRIFGEVRHEGDVLAGAAGRFWGGGTVVIVKTGS